MEEEDLVGRKGVEVRRGFVENLFKVRTTDGNWFVRGLGQNQFYSHSVNVVVTSQAFLFLSKLTFKLVQPQASLLAKQDPEQASITVFFEAVYTYLGDGYRLKNNPIYTP